MRPTNLDGLAAGNVPAMTTAMAAEPPREEELSLASVFRTVLKHKLIFLGVAVLVFGAVVIETLTMTPIYESTSRLEIDPSKSSSLGLDEMINQKLGSSEDSNGIQTEVRVIQSDTVAMRVIDGLALAKSPVFAGKNAERVTVTDPLAMSPADRERLLGQFHGSLSVKVLPATNIVEIRFRSTDPKLAAAVNNAIVERYMQARPA